MVVDKKLNIVLDLVSMNKQQFDDLIKANEDIIKKAQKQEQKQKSKSQKTKKREKENTESIVDEVISGRGITDFVTEFKTAIPFITPILLATGFFVSKLLALDKLNKKFIDIADTRISRFIGRQQRALLESRQIQTIYTTAAGGTSPRDSYNSFNDFDRSVINNGVDRDVSANRGID